MIKYDAGHMGLLFVVGYKGSVFPKAMAWAIPNAILAFVLHMYARQDQIEGNIMSMTGVNALWTGYTSVLGFLVVFRNNQAYTRFWEGATLINQVRGEWFNAVSTLFAFCNQNKEFQEKVETFQHTLVRLASMLYCSALQQVCDLQDDTLEIIENQGLDSESLSFMAESNDRCEILLQWIQRLIVDCEEQKTIKIAPPLLTRAFQELSRGIVNLNNARKIKDIPFPFPYAQMITCMLIVHWIVTPVLASQIIQSQAAACVVCFFVTFAFWCLIYIALEIDQPFGEDDNDLPIREMQRDFNLSLLNLMHPLAQKVPTYQAPETPSWQPMLSRSDSALARSTVLVGNIDMAEVEAESESQTNAPQVFGMVSPMRMTAATRTTEHKSWFDRLLGGKSLDPPDQLEQPAIRVVRASSAQDIVESEVTPPGEPQVLPLPIRSTGEGKAATQPPQHVPAVSAEGFASSEAASEVALGEAGAADTSGERGTRRDASQSSRKSTTFSKRPLHLSTMRSHSTDSFNLQPPQGGAHHRSSFLIRGSSNQHIQETSPGTNRHSWHSKDSPHQQDAPSSPGAAPSGSNGRRSEASNVETSLSSNSTGPRLEV